jgi:hypothetical protein
MCVQANPDQYNVMVVSFLTSPWVTDYIEGDPFSLVDTIGTIGVRQISYRYQMTRYRHRYARMLAHDKQARGTCISATLCHGRLCLLRP